jgi:hypothetical protein
VYYQYLNWHLLQHNGFFISDFTGKNGERKIYIIKNIGGFCRTGVVCDYQ